MKDADTIYVLATMDFKESIEKHFSFILRIMHDADQETCYLVTEALKDERLSAEWFRSKDRHELQQALDEVIKDKSEAVQRIVTHMFWAKYQYNKVKWEVEEFERERNRHHATDADRFREEVKS